MVLRRTFSSSAVFPAIRPSRMALYPPANAPPVSSARAEAILNPAEFFATLGNSLAAERAPISSILPNTFFFVKS